MKDIYTFDRSKVEAERLNAQHVLWTKNFGYLVHPDIRSKLNSFSRIADVGTGTGVFLEALSKDLPGTCQFDGFDISQAQFKAREDLPTNINLHQHDAKLPFEENYHGEFDLIHLRLLVQGMEKHDWAIVVKNLTQLLKPGGAIQWLEGDIYHATYHRGEPGSTTKAMTLLSNHFTKTMAHKLMFGYCTLPSIFEEHGLVGVFQDVVASDRISETRTELTALSVNGMYGWARVMLANRAPGAWSAEEIANIRHRCDDEIAAGGYLRFNMHATIGFKR